MACEYTKIISTYAYQQGIPNALQSVTIGAGMKRLIKVGFPSQGRLSDVDVHQSDAGTPVAFTVDVLKSKLPFTPDTDVAVAAAATYPIAPLQICSTLNGTAGNSAELQLDVEGYPYRNIDGSFTNNQRYVYVLINPTGAIAPTTWDIFLTCEYDVQ